MPVNRPREAVSRLLALPLCVLIVLAGCSLPVGSPTPTPDRVAPGVTASSLVNASALAAANEESLREGATIRRNYTDRIPEHDGYLIRHKTTTRIGSNFERFHHATDTWTRHNGSTSTSTTETWSNGSVVFTRFANATVERFGRHDADRFPYGPANLTYTTTVRDLRDGNVTRIGDDRYRLAYTHRTRGRGTRNVTSEGLAVFDGEGRVSTVSVEAAFDTRVGRSHVSETVRWTARGETSVPRPAWVDEAANATSR